MKVILWANGMAIVFDEHGEQVVELQGRYDEVKDKIRAVYDGPWSFGVWLDWLQDGLDFDEIERLVVQLKASWHEEQV